MNGKISNPAQVAGIRRYILCDGAEKGLEVLDCDNGKLRFLLNVGKALDVMQLYHEGTNLSFISKNGFTAREIPFGRRFEGGMLYTCGHDNVGDRAGYEIHGTLHNTPARVLRAECDGNGITVEAETVVSALFGEHLVLRRRVTSGIGSDTLTVSDVIENRGYGTSYYCMLYHCNVGYPMLDEGVTVKGDVRTCTPRTPWAAEKEAEREIITAPSPREEETCYFLTFGEPRVTVRNEKIGKALTLSWSKETLPCFVEWKSMACGDYALGLEPSTTELDDRFATTALAAGETRKTELSFRVEKL